MKNFPPQLNFVATLPCKTNISVNVNHYNNAVYSAMQNSSKTWQRR